MKYTSHQHGTITVPNVNQMGVILLLDQQLYELLKEDFYNGLQRSLTTEEKELLRWISYKEFRLNGITLETKL
ncbi:hypothetical protein [Evansella tamaricis]|uniref:Uncharacterized protein n=1 Tax=Evansella tamaricis TaxID=2069301 RepID=A0ABS6JIT4_9BACI|nr:hypothetical protein [Evansella tamaricis]MBU9712238.1 hypothetical protein [Evansella tamaricis]